MTTLSERLESLAIRVTSPDNRIRATLRAGRSIECEFRPGAYDEYRQGDLEHQLGRLATLAWTGYQRGYQLAVAEATGTRPSGEQQSWDPNRRRYREALDASQHEGISPERWIRVRCTGMSHWTVDLRTGYHAALPEPRFLTELSSAAGEIIRDRRLRAARLKDEHYGLDIPAELRARFARAR
ncbi:hypothetical protein Afil01_29310 [Actinorhabdospora filicis]|uniref:Uncharacterized protein n=1 Tax=Actinorhabdospora filicis TaxID=1785913 RepID=A0A9W6W920_9ACTN|nr:hypothetical protein [Actinorhabdospora filicis]GLZ78124.1 hypothetical protein Afil01_29310 [Actinorhabdospora filicis]